MTALKSPFQFTVVASVAAAGAYLGHTSQVIESAATNTANPYGSALPSPHRGTSVDSTVQFIQANYDSLFKRLAD